MAEACVGTVKSILKKICTDHPYGWAEASRFAALVYNQSYQSTIGASPYFARHGVHPRTLADLVLGTGPPKETKWHHSISARRDDIAKHVTSEIAKLGNSHAKRNAKVRGKRSFVTGDIVYLHQVYPESFAKAGMDTSFYPAYRAELFKVTEVISPQLYRIAERDAPH